MVAPILLEILTVLTIVSMLVVTHVYYQIVSILTAVLILVGVFVPVGACGIVHAGLWPAKLFLNTLRLALGTY